MARKFFVGGNFKMNGTVKSIQDIIENLNNATFDPNTEVVIAPPTLYLLTSLAAAKSHIQISAQNAYIKSSGAFTGEISPTQLVDAKVPWVILGHSERRTLFGETDEIVADKTKAALDAGLSVILCIGETLEEREAGITKDICERQLAAVKAKVSDVSEWSKIVIAYEPVWAIGTGKVATCAQAQDAHADIRAWVSKNVSPQTAEEIRIIYGGSVNAGNCKESAAQQDVDGFLVGGASLKPDSIQFIGFLGVCAGTQRATTRCSSIDSIREKQHVKKIYPIGISSYAGSSKSTLINIVQSLQRRQTDSIPKFSSGDLVSLTNRWSLAMGA
ncbi:hypothetical protein OPQ81_000140 [Rhizoctonia solani]|nr:hypothetical protein OPQ81_000140 [Rhizoctonia solani]